MLSRKIYIFATSLILMLIIFCSCGVETIHVKIFSEISECENIDALKSESAIIEIYDTTKKDYSLHDLVASDFYGCNYEDSDLQFELFAYVFFSEEEAKKYFANVTGKKSDLDINFSDSIGADYYRRVVIYGKSAYWVKSKKEYSDKINDFINQCFSIEIYRHEDEEDT